MLVVAAKRSPFLGKVFSTHQSFSSLILSDLADLRSNDIGDRSASVVFVAILPVVLISLVKRKYVLRVVSVGMSWSKISLAISTNSFLSSADLSRLGILSIMDFGKMVSMHSPA